jgi:hypothetical protein
MKYLLTLIFTAFLYGSIWATIINVPADQPTIQAGIDAATDGDTVLVQPDTYLEYFIKLQGKNIVVGSLFLTTGDTSYISNTVIDGDSTWSVVWIESGELNGFTITNGFWGWGGGITIRGGNPTLMNLIVCGNTAAIGGGGIHCSDSSYATLINVIITGNKCLYGGSADGGGGISCWGSRMYLMNVTISDNSALSGSSGIFCKDSSDMHLVNTIIWNSSQGEIFDPDLVVNVFYSDIQGGWPGVGNIDTDPMFVDPANGDYRLQVGSPCIDAGIQDTMIIYNNGQDTLIVPSMSYMGYAPDMGAYESPYFSAININDFLPNNLILHQNYPNPFNPSTKIKFILPKPETVKIEVYNIIGQKIKTLLNKHMLAGYHEVEFNGQNLSSGIYLYRMEAGEYHDLKKMILLK